MVPLIKFIAARSGVEHDGTSMIVMNEGKETRAPAGAQSMLEEKGYIDGSVSELGSDAVAGSADEKLAALRAAIVDGADSDELLALIDGTPAGDEDDDGVPDGYSVEKKSGGWWDLTGPEGFEPVRGRGDDALRDALGALANSGPAA